MEEFEKLLAPADEPISSTRNGTALSRYCEGIVVTFINYRASHAVVKVEEADYGFDQLYWGLRNICKKNDFKNKVEVHKQNGKLMLIQRKPK